MFGNILKTPEGRKTFKRVMVDALRAGTATSAVTPTYRHENVWHR